MERFLRDFVAGLVFAAFGAAAIHFVREYPLGTAMHMGPGYFPAALGWILIGFGAFLCVRGLWRWVPSPRRTKQADGLDFVKSAPAPAPAGAPVPVPAAAWDWREATWSVRPVACIAAAMLVFGFVMPRLGLIPALVPMFFVAALGGREFRWREVLVLTLVMTAFAVGVFVVLLKLTFQLFPGFYLV
jgi:Tripartite tricarboxylate transporter TctB family